MKVARRPAGAESTSAISAAGLSKRYGDTLALDGLDLTVAHGEVYGYLGRCQRETGRRCS